MTPAYKKPLVWFQVRSNSRKRFDEASLRELGKSLRVRQLQALVCLPDGIIICGERRFRAAQMEGLDDLEVKIITDPISEAEFDRLQLVENLQREELTNAEKCEGCVKFAKLNPTTAHKQIAEQLHVSPSLITIWMSWAKAIEPVRQALAADGITLNEMYGITQKPDQAAALAEKLADRAVRRQRKSPAENDGSVARVKQLKVPLASGAVVQISGASVTLGDCIEAAQDALKAMKKAQADGLDSRTAQAVFRDVAAKARVS